MFINLSLRRAIKGDPKATYSYSLDTEMSWSKLMSMFLNNQIWMHFARQLINPPHSQYAKNELQNVTEPLQENSF